MSRTSRAFADEVAIDFPSSTAAIEFFRRDRGEPDDVVRSTSAEITISAGQAGTGAWVPLDLTVARTCACCGGRGETWSEPCEPCAVEGRQIYPQRLTVAVPPGVADGARFSFSVSPARGPRTRVDVRVAVLV